MKLTKHNLLNLESEISNGYPHNKVTIERDKKTGTPKWKVRKRKNANPK